MKSAWSSRFHVELIDLSYYSASLCCQGCWVVWRWYDDEDEDEDDDDEDDEDASTTLKVVTQRKFFGKFSETQELNFSDENHISPTRITFRKKHWKYSEIKVDENYNREE